MDTKTTDQQAAKSVAPSFWVGVTLVYLVISAIPLILGKDIAWWQAWVYAILVFAAGVGGRAWAEINHPGLMAERGKMIPKKDTKPWDKVLSPLMSFSVAFPLYIVAGLDHRNGWSPVIPLWLNLVGLVLVGGGYAFAIWAMVEDRFFSSMVRIQTDRGHEVCDRGPYRIVRHPGYLGNILPLPGIALALGSAWTFIPAAFALIVILTRTVLEDKTLQEELPGYREYAGRVRYRLFLGIY